MRSAAITLAGVIIVFILTLIAIMLAHWKRFRHETDRYRAWQSVFGPRGGKVALIAIFISLSVLVGLLLGLDGMRS